MVLRCFIAMAFDRDDTDAIYDKFIKRALKQFGIKPIRIDKIEHNDDIDDRIMSELKQCDMIISDLTYARPSVYFEAGFGTGRSHESEKKIPVIFTCRKDHFRPKTDDPYGNFRVHFDLQMRNIIAWFNISDASFYTRLKKRINYVISPLLDEIKQNKKLEEKISRFTHMSSQNKISKILYLGTKYYKKHGYDDGILIGNRYGRPLGIDYPYHHRDDKEFRIHYPTSGFYRSHMQPNRLSPTWISSKFTKDLKTTLFFFVTPNLTKTLLDYLDGALLSLPIYSLIPPSKSQQLKALREILLICSIGKVNSNKIMNSFTDFSYHAETDDYSCTYGQMVPIRKIDQWKQIFSNSNGTYFYANLRKIADHDDTARYHVKDSYLVENYFNRKKWEHMDRSIMKLKRIPRQIRIKVFDDIKSDEHLIKALEKYSTFIKETG